MRQSRLDRIATAGQGGGEPDVVTGAMMRVLALGLLMMLASCGGVSAGNEAAAGGPSSTNDVSATVVDADPNAAAPMNDAVVAAPTNADQPITDDTAPAAAKGDALPPDVIAFKAKREECDHLRGEDTENEARAAELEGALNRTCKGTDAALAGLRKRYAGDAAVIAALADYEADVE